MAKRKKIEDPIERELDYIKRLLILQLYKNGVSQGDVAKALDVDAAEISRMMPARAFLDKKEKSKSKPAAETPND